MKTTSNFIRIVPTLALTAWVLACQSPQNVSPPEILSFAGSANALAAAGKVTLTWETKNATAISITALGGNAVEGVADQAAGSLELEVNQTTVYVLRAQNARGLADSAAVQVEVAAKPSELLFTASPPSIAPGETAVLAWSASGAKKVTIVDGTGAELDLQGQGAFGSITVTPSTDTTYSLKTGAFEESLTISVKPQVKTFAATPPFASAGAPIQLSWETSGAQSIELELAGSGVLLNEMDPAKVAQGEFSYTIPATASNDAVFTFLLHARGLGNAVSSTQPLVVYISKEPVITEFVGPAYGKVGGNIVLSWKTNANEVRLAADGVEFFQTTTSATSGTLTLPTPASKTEYTLLARNLRGGQVSQKLQTDVVGIPSIGSFTVTPDTLATAGSPVSLSWNVPHARRVRVIAKSSFVGTGGADAGSGTYAVQFGVVGAEGSAAEAGSFTVYPNETTLYELIADNQAGDTVTASATATVSTSGELSFSDSDVPTHALINLTGTSLSGVTESYGLPQVVKSAPGEAFIDISATGTDIGTLGPDTGAKLFALNRPFDTVLYGVPVSSTNLSISTNGWFMFSNNSVSGPDNNATPLPSTALEPLAIAPYWDDLYMVADSKVYVRHEGFGLQARLIVQWNEVEHDDYPGSRLTFQAQVYASGKVVFAYQKLQGITAGDAPSVGIVDRLELDCLIPGAPPAENDTYTFFGRTNFPAPVRAYATPYVVRAVVSSGLIQLTGTPTLFAPDQFIVSEINPAPLATVVDGEWFEVFNRTSNPIDLKDWVLNFGGTNTHTIATSLVVPPNGYVLLGQSPTAGDGLAVDYVYGNALQLPDGAGVLSIGKLGTAYTQLPYEAASAAAPPGASLVFDKRSDLLFASGVEGLSCPGTSTYGTHGQTGTPKAANDPCPPYQLGAIPGAFESILTSGADITPADPDEGITHLTLPDPIKIAHLTFSTLSVGSNGFVLPRTVNCASGNCFYANRTSPIPGSGPFGAIAPFWDDLDKNASNSGVFWERKDPDATPGSGDEYTIISWENYKFYDYDGELNFQIKFFENGNIEFHYGAMSALSPSLALGGSATSWIEEPLGRAAFKVNVNSSSPGIAPNSGYRLTKL